MKIAILLTCFNRKEKTLDCLKCLSKALEKDINATYSIFLVDDGSTDGTAEEVSKVFPNINILKGTGNLFWNGGMHLAFSTAISEGFDWYCWLNDDVSLNDTAFEHFSSLKQDSIYIGATMDIKRVQRTYGGGINTNRLRPLEFQPLPISDKIQESHTMNGNFVLIPKEIVKVIGINDKKFIHSFGDMDYAFRARKAGYTIYQLPSYVGRCDNNSIEGTWADKSLSFRTRLKLREKPTGLPFKNFLRMNYKYGGILWPLRVLKSYIDLLFTSNKK